MQAIPYASGCGSLMYVMVSTRPDIAYGIGVVRRFMSQPGQSHWAAIKSILRYLKGTQEKNICYGKGDLNLPCYFDSDMAGDVDTRKSTYGYIYTLAGGDISQCSMLQRIVALATESQHISATEASKEAIWLTRLRSELGLPKQIPVLHCDNQIVICLAKNPVHHERTKHIDIHYHFHQRGNRGWSNPIGKD